MYCDAWCVNTFLLNIVLMDVLQTRLGVYQKVGSPIIQFINHVDDFNVEVHLT